MNNSIDLKEYLGQHVTIVFNEHMPEPDRATRSGFLANGRGIFRVFYFLMFDDPVGTHSFCGPFLEDRVESITVSPQLFSPSHLPELSLYHMGMFSLYLYPVTL